MAAYRRQRAKHKFEARSPAELSLQKGDMIRVWQSETGEWPDMDNWVTGENERTKLKGEFPGNYTVFVEEIEPEDIPPPLPIKPDQNGPTPPPVPARHASEPPSLLPPHSRQPPPISPRHQPETRGFLPVEPRRASQTEPWAYPQPEPRGHIHSQSEVQGYPPPEPRYAPQPEPRNAPQPEPRVHPPPTEPRRNAHDLVPQECNRPVKCAACE